MRTPDLAAAHALALSLVRAPSPPTWTSAALADLPTLLLDHAECEKKAAANAMSLMHRYASMPWLCGQLSRFAREELRHYEMVLAFCRRQGVTGRPPPAARYGAGLKGWVRSAEPSRLLDLLLVAAMIEARSLERFGSLVAATNGSALADFYGKLLASEARHARGYLALAARADTRSELPVRWDALRDHEQALVDAPDSVLRFHSGLPAWLTSTALDTSAVAPDGWTRNTAPPLGDQLPST